MKKQVSLVGVVIGLVVLGANAGAVPKTSAEIVLPTKANGVELLAAKELSEHWRKATGEEVKTVAGATGTARWLFRLGPHPP